MKSDFTLAFNEIVETRSLPREVVLNALKQALVSAYKRDARVIDTQHVEADIAPDGAPRLLIEKEVIIGEVINPQTEVELSLAQEHYPDAQEGDMVMMPVTTLSKTFGRIAAQTAKQVILQHIREAEREQLYEEFIEKEGDIVTGTIQSVSSGSITLELLGRAEAVMPHQQRCPTERYRPHDKIRVFIAEVKKSNRGPQIIVSRNHKDMLRRLLEYEVPEIYNGQIEIKNIAREAGYRSKVAVLARQEGLDAVGACVGMRGMRIQNIVKELSEEKIDIIEWDNNPIKYISRALSPARVSRVFLEEELDSVRTATVIVPEDQLSLAIGREGQNARLAAKLTGWRIDIKSVLEAARYAVEHIEEAPLVSMLETHAELVVEADRILQKKAVNRAVTPEEYTTISEFAVAAETLLFRQRQDERRGRLDSIEMVRGLVPEAAFSIPLQELELAEDIMRVIAHLGNVGELWVRYMADEEGLNRNLKVGGAAADAMDAIRDALDDLVIPEVTTPAEEEGEVQPEDESEAPVDAEEAEMAVEAAEQPQPEPDVVESQDVQEAVEADVKISAEDEAEMEAAQPVEVEAEAEAVEARAEEATELYDDEDLAELELRKKKKSKKKAKQRRRQLIFDEEIGEVISKRRRKRGTDAFEDDYEEYF